MNSGGTGKDPVQSPGGAARLGPGRVAALDQEQKTESGGLNLSNRQVWNAVK